MEPIHETVCPDCQRTVETNWDHPWYCPVALREAAQAAAEWELKVAAKDQFRSEQATGEDPNLDMWDRLQDYL